jgi:hypothetical protein
VPYYAVISRTTLLLVLAHICSSTERMASDHDSSPDPTRHRGVPLPEIGRRLTTIGQGASPHVKPLRYMGHETKKRQIRIGHGGNLRMNVKEREPEGVRVHVSQGQDRYVKHRIRPKVLHISYFGSSTVEFSFSLNAVTPLFR